MKNYRYIALDPSGNFTEGKGITGTCLFDTVENRIIEVTNIAAKNHFDMCDYWNAHTAFIFKNAAKYIDDVIIVIEDYVLYANKAADQINSRMETPKLLGVLQLYCYNNDIPFKMQLASAVKNRWADNILVHKKYLQPHGTTFKLYGTGVKVSRHVKDAIRHAVHYATFYNKGATT